MDLGCLGAAVSSYQLLVSFQRDGCPIYELFLSPEVYAVYCVMFLTIQIDGLTRDESLLHSKLSMSTTVHTSRMASPFTACDCFGYHTLIVIATAP